MSSKQMNFAPSATMSAYCVRHTKFTRPWLTVNTPSVCNVGPVSHYPLDKSQKRSLCAQGNRITYVCVDAINQYVTRRLCYYHRAEDSTARETHGVGSEQLACIWREVESCTYLK